MSLVGEVGASLVGEVVSSVVDVVSSVGEVVSRVGEVGEIGSGRGCRMEWVCRGVIRKWV